MNYKIKVLSWCYRQLKQLKKKYPHIKEDLGEVGKILLVNPQAGDRIPGIKAPLYKIRMGFRDQKRGKRGGFRVVYYFKGKDGVICLVTIYSKSEQASFDMCSLGDPKQSLIR